MHFSHPFANKTLIISKTVQQKRLYSRYALMKKKRDAIGLIPTMASSYLPDRNFPCQMRHVYSFLCSNRKLYCISSRSFSDSSFMPRVSRILKPISMDVPAPLEVRMFPEETNTLSR